MALSGVRPAELIAATQSRPAAVAKPYEAVGAMLGVSERVSKRLGHASFAGA